MQHKLRRFSFVDRRDWVKPYRGPADWIKNFPHHGLRMPKKSVATKGAGFIQLFAALHRLACTQDLMAWHLH